MSAFDKTVIPDELTGFVRDPWFDRPFDRLTVLSKVEGESRKKADNQIILDPGLPR